MRCEPRDLGNAAKDLVPAQSGSFGELGQSDGSGRVGFDAFNGSVHAGRNEPASFALASRPQRAGQDFEEQALGLQSLWIGRLSRCPVQLRQRMGEPLGTEDGAEELEPAARREPGLVLKPSTYDCGLDVQHLPRPRLVSDRSAVMHLAGIHGDHVAGAGFDLADAAEGGVSAGHDHTDSEFVVRMFGEAVVGHSLDGAYTANHRRARYYSRRSHGRTPIIGREPCQPCTVRAWREPARDDDRGFSGRLLASSRDVAASHLDMEGIEAQARLHSMGTPRRTSTMRLG